MTANTNSYTKYYYDINDLILDVEFTHKKNIYFENVTSLSDYFHSLDSIFSDEEDEFLPNSKLKFFEIINAEDFDVLFACYNSNMVPKAVRKDVRDQLFITATREDFFQSYDVLHSKVLMLYVHLAYLSDYSDSEFANNNMLYSVVAAARENHSTELLKNYALKFNDDLLLQAIETLDDLSKENAALEHVKKYSYPALIRYYRDSFSYVSSVSLLSHYFSKPVLRFAKERLLSSALLKSQLEEVYGVARNNFDDDFALKVLGRINDCRKADYFIKA